MIIDSHAHYGGQSLFPHMTIENLLKSMVKYNIDISIVSNADACEFDSNLNLINKKNSKTQIEVNEILLNKIKPHKDKIKALFWCKANLEEADEKIFDFIKQNKDVFLGLKIHPYHSNLSIDDEKYIPYFEIARKLDIPVAIHSASNKVCTPKLIYNVARENKDIKFIMVHLGLGTDNEEAIEYVSKLDNLYGDTTWVPYENILKAVKKCSSEKILFGTDSPIDGVDTNKFYRKLLETTDLSKKEIDNVMYKNTQKLFRMIRG